MHQPRRPWTPQSRHAIREILAHPTADRAVELAGSRNAAVRVALAASSATPIGVLIHLSTDSHPAVRAAVAGNPAVVLSVSTVRRLAHDDNEAVVVAIRHNAEVPNSLWAAAASVAA